jgi:hypothetical protein
MIDSAYAYGMKEYEMRPNNIDVNRNLAEIYLLKNDLAKANEHIAVASRTGCKNPELLAVADRIKNETDKTAAK